MLGYGLKFTSLQLGFTLRKLALWRSRFQDIATSTEFVDLVKMPIALCCHRSLHWRNNWYLKLETNGPLWFRKYGWFGQPFFSIIVISVLHDRSLNGISVLELVNMFFLLIVFSPILSLMHLHYMKVTDEIWVDSQLFDHLMVSSEALV